MTILNELNEKTEKVIHLLVTTLCDRNCQYCCNKQYDLSDIPQVTPEELSRAEIICLTGGEPFSYSKPNEIAGKLKKDYPNIKKVYVYTNAYELNQYIDYGANRFTNLDGLNVSVKSVADAECIDEIVSYLSVRRSLPDNRIYVFNNLYSGNPDRFEVIHREWQKDFKPADDSIFRRI